VSLPREARLSTMVTEAGMDGAVRLEVYRFFVEQGRPPVSSEIAESLHSTQASVEDALRRLADAHVPGLAPGTTYIWMANPLSALPTMFSVEATGRTWFANCMWDAFGAVAMLGGTGTVRTWCPDCGERVAVSVQENRLSSGEGVFHVAVPAAGGGTTSDSTERTCSSSGRKSMWSGGTRHVASAPGRP